jgi:hypothetical protein
MQRLRSVVLGLMLDSWRGAASAILRAMRVVHVMR